MPLVQFSKKMAIIIINLKKDTDLKHVKKGVIKIFPSTSIGSKY